MTGRKDKKMEIGLLALAVGVLFYGIGLAGIGTVQPPERKEEAVRYPYPKEL